MKSLHSVSTGGILIKDNKVLLVQVNYGPNKGLWMIPGGIVEPGESLEEAVKREIKEETGLVLNPKRIVGLRNGVKQVNNMVEASIYVVFEMEYISGITKALDINEISNIEFFSIEEALSNSNVIDLSKEFISAAYESTLGIQKVEKEIITNTHYKSYDVYRT
ncbi:NUDIX domain-containing protein [Lederbergia panacisoli]|uniref:NUDIX domain-containing protein n=1 Tax=Lederbergia panacisoli TaxID=1255251 RepID=UPI00214B224E|nr:NUDIX domain-containing protein [Lederbergia panacisoli]MCR2822315.1 NUDIX domain-containing protein [Lederbergia panacisoli]